MTTAFFTDPRTDDHTLPDHPENAARLQAIIRRLEESGILARLDCRTPLPATDEQLLLVHTARHLALIAEAERRGQPAMLDADTYICPESNLAARLSAGAALEAVDAVLSGAAANALVALRPPGHHALPDRALGFCLFSNVALAARHAQARHGAARVLIVDYDVHHGNGTQDVFYTDGSVLFISTHQSPLFPGTGHIDEIGAGPGEGATINVPLPAGHGDPTFAAIYEQIVWPAARRFAPDLILVSAGFDAHWSDPLAGLTLTLAGYDRLTRALVRMAQELCGGRIVFVLEGGYSLPALAEGVLNVAYALLGDPPANDPLPLPEGARRRQQSAGSAERLLERVRAIHGL